MGGIRQRGFNPAPSNPTYDVKFIIKAPKSWKPKGPLTYIANQAGVSLVNITYLKSAFFRRRNTISIMLAGRADNLRLAIQLLAFHLELPESSFEVLRELDALIEEAGNNE